MNGLAITFLALSGCIMVSANGCYSNLPSYGQEVRIGSSFQGNPVGLPCSAGLQVSPSCSSAYSGAVGNICQSSPVESCQSGPIFSSGPKIIESSLPIQSNVQSYNLQPFAQPAVQSFNLQSFPQPAVQSFNLQPVAQRAIVEQPIYSGPSYLSGSDNCGPAPRPAPIRYLSPVFLKPQDEPIRELPSPKLPPPVVVANKCSCTKVVQKPQLYQRLVVSQKNQRFLKKTYVPRTEKVEYSAKPRC